MAGSVSTSASATLLLGTLDEPLALRADLLQLVHEHPDHGHLPIVRALSTSLWRSWRALLAPLGMRISDLRIIMASYDREILLWVVGDRPWAHMITGLVGRIERRLPDKS
jgi:hypothetical protein